MPDMSVAALTCYFHSLYKHAHILVDLNILFSHNSGETRPARAGIELCIRAEQRIGAADAPEKTGFVKLIIGARKGSIGTLPACDVVLFGVEQFPPLGIR